MRKIFRALRRFFLPSRAEVFLSEGRARWEAQADARWNRMLDLHRRGRDE